MASMDEATLLTALGPGHYRGHTAPEFWNATGPFGGWGAALALRSVLEDDRAAGEPLALAVQFMGGMEAGPVSVTAAPVRINRTTSFWQSVIGQPPGEKPPAILATTTLGKRRGSFGHREQLPPDIPPPENIAVTPYPPNLPSFLYNYELHYAKGYPLPEKRPGHMIAWARDKAGTPLTVYGLVGLGDLGFPILWNYTGAYSMIATVSYTMHFHADPTEISTVNDDFVLLEWFGRRAHDGFYDQTALMWSRDGKLLASSDQMVWFRPNREQG